MSCNIDRLCSSFLGLLLLFLSFFFPGNSSVERQTKTSCVDGQNARRREERALDAGLNQTDPASYYLGGYYIIIKIRP
jgi:hypothetical protein